MTRRGEAGGRWARTRVELTGLLPPTMTDALCYPSAPAMVVPERLRHADR